MPASSHTWNNQAVTIHMILYIVSNFIFLYKQEFQSYLQIKFSNSLIYENWMIRIYGQLKMINLEYAALLFCNIRFINDIVNKNQIE